MLKSLTSFVPLKFEIIFLFFFCYQYIKGWKNAEPFYLNHIHGLGHNQAKHDDFNKKNLFKCENKI